MKALKVFHVLDVCNPGLLCVVTLSVYLAAIHSLPANENKIMKRIAVLIKQNEIIQVL